MAVTRRNSVSKTWNGAVQTWDDAVKGFKSLTFNKQGKNSSSVYSAAKIKLVSYNIKQATKQVEDAECTAMKAVQDAKAAKKALTKVSAAVNKLKTKTTTGAKKSKTTKRKTGTKTAKTKARRYRAA